MLDIRATSFVSPLSEVDFASVPLTVHIVNVADETGLINGKFRIYNGSTGLLIHTSDIAPLTMVAGQVADVSALTDFDPPAPADDTYFVCFDGNASNALVPDGINFALGAFYFDVKPVGMGPAQPSHHLTHEEGGSDEIPIEDMGTAELNDTLVLAPDGTGGVVFRAETGGGAPAAHAASHENAGSDEISVAGLSGVLANPQTPAAHDHAGDDLKFTKVHPAADATTALQVLKADDTTVVLNVDTTNRRLGINTNAPTHDLHVVQQGGPAGIFVTGGTNPQIRLESSATTKLQCDDYYPGGAVAYFGTESNHRFLILTNNTSRIIVLTDGKVGISTDAPTALLDVNGDIIRLRTAKTPASAGAAGNAGDICWDTDYIYVCVATNTWKRAAIATW